jgi:hypothetical protein
MLDKELLPMWSRNRVNLDRTVAYEGIAIQASTPDQAEENRRSEDPDPRQNSRGFERMDALPLSICLGKPTPG